MPIDILAYISELETAPVNSEEVFRDLFSRGVELLHITDVEVAREFGVSLPTVARWKNGSNAPHQAMKKPVYAWLKGRAEEKA